MREPTPRACGEPAGAGRGGRVRFVRPAGIRAAPGRRFRGALAAVHAGASAAGASARAAVGSSAPSGSGVGRLAHQTSQRAPSTGIFRTTSRKKMGRNPSTRQGLRQLRPCGAAALRPALPCHPRARPATSGPPGLGVGLLEAEVRIGRYEQGWLALLFAPASPFVTALVEVVVDPGQRPAPRELLERPQLPMGGAEAGGAVEAITGSSGSPRRGAGRRWRGPPSPSPRPARSGRRGGAAASRPRARCSGPCRRSARSARAAIRAARRSRTG